MTLEQTIDKIMQTIERDIPLVVGNEAVNFALDNFQKQGFQGASFEPWPERKKETPKTRGKPILTQSAALRRSLQIKKMAGNEVVVGTAGQIRYAKIHNEGGVVHTRARSETFRRNRYTRGSRRGQFKKGVAPGRGFTFRSGEIYMPQRKFLGDSPVLRERINAAIIQKITNTINNLT